MQVVQKVRIKNISKSFGAHLAVNNATIDINAGEMFFLLGPSGCGKTTLLRMLAGFESPTSGQIFFNDDDVTNIPPNQRQTGMVFQGYALWPHMTVYENIAYGLRIQKKSPNEIKSLVNDALDSVELSGLQNRRPNALSGGQQQRVALARALVVRPRVLLLDEPLSNLDAGLRASMRLEIREICKKSNITTIYVTHDQKEALAIADRIALMRNGFLEQVGSPEDLYNSPKNEFVASFLGETNLIKGDTATSFLLPKDSLLRKETCINTISDSFPGKNIQKNNFATLSIRPEDVHIIPSNSNTETNDSILIFEGKIEHAIFLGDCFNYEIKVGCEVLKSVLNKEHKFKKNDIVKVKIKKENIISFKEK